MTKLDKYIAEVEIFTSEAIIEIHHDTKKLTNMLGLGESERCTNTVLARFSG